MSSSIDSVTIHSGVTALTLRRRLVKAWRALLAPVASHAAVIQYAESATRVTVGDEGCIVIGGRLDLGPGSIIYSRHGGGFVIEMPSAAEAEATGA